MKKLIIIALVAASTPILFGQIKNPKPIDALAEKSPKTETKAENADDVVANKPMFQRFDNLVVPDERYEGIKGNRYFYDNQYHEGALVLTQNRTMGNGYAFRYDQLEGTVQMKYPDGKEILVDQKEILNFDLFVENKSVMFIRMKTPNTETFSLVQIIYFSPTFQLVREPRKKLKRVENTGAYSPNVIYDTYENDYHYFIKRGKDNLLEVKPTVKSLSKAMPDKTAKIESLFKAAKSKGELSVTKLADIIKKLDDSIKTEKTESNQ